jgi:hypothetical protein
MLEYREQCPISWCQVGNPHGRHEQVLATAHGEVPGLRQGRTVQLIVFGYDEFAAQPALTIINPRTLAQESAALFWEDALRMAAELDLAAGRFRARR